MSEQKIDLIAKLLAKAEQTTPEEAEALTAAAEKLMIKYAIDQAVIDARRAREGKTSEKIVQLKLRFEGVYRNDFLEMGAAVVWGLGQMKVLQSKMDKYTVMWIVGYESDAAQAEILVRSLQVQAIVALKTWWYDARYTPRYQYMPENEKKHARRQFVRSFGSGAGNRIRENRASAIHEAGTGTELVLVDRASKVQEWIDDNLTLAPNRDKGHKHYDHGAHVAGNQAGRNANTGERSMTMGRGLPAGATR